MVGGVSPPENGVDRVLDVVVFAAGVGGDLLSDALHVVTDNAWHSNCRSQFLSLQRKGHCSVARMQQLRFLQLPS